MVCHFWHQFLTQFSLLFQMVPFFFLSMAALRTTNTKLSDWLLELFQPIRLWLSELPYRAKWMVPSERALKGDWALRLLYCSRGIGTACICILLSRGFCTSKQKCTTISASVYGTIGRRRALTEIWNWDIFTACVHSNGQLHQPFHSSLAKGSLTFTLLLKCHFGSWALTRHTPCLPLRHSSCLSYSLRKKKVLIKLHN